MPVASANEAAAASATDGGGGVIATAIATNGGGHWKGNENGDGDANGNEKMNAIDCGNTIASCATGCGSWRCDCESATDSTCGYESGCFFSPRIWHWRRDQEQLRWLLLPPPLLLLLVLLLLLLLLVDWLTWSGNCCANEPFLCDEAPFFPGGHKCKHM